MYFVSGHSLLDELIDYIGVGPDEWIHSVPQPLNDSSLMVNNICIALAHEIMHYQRGVETKLTWINELFLSIDQNNAIETNQAIHNRVR